MKINEGSIGQVNSARVQDSKLNLKREAVRVLRLRTGVRTGGGTTTTASTITQGELDTSN